MKNILFILLLINIVSCKAQIKTDTMREKFNFELYKNFIYGSDENNTLENGNIIFQMYFSDKNGGYQREWRPKPSFLAIYRTYYKNGYLKSKEYRLGKRVEIGTSQYYDEQGRLKEVNEDAKFGKIKPKDVLNFLEQKGYINQQTGEGRERITLSYVKNKNYWFISISEGKINPNPSTLGTSGDYTDLDYSMDGETGEVCEVDEVDEDGNPVKTHPSSSIYKTYKGRNYTEKEWKDFVEKDVQAYLQRKNRSFLAD